MAVHVRCVFFFMMHHKKIFGEPKLRCLVDMARHIESKRGRWKIETSIDCCHRLNAWKPQAITPTSIPLRARARAQKLSLHPSRLFKAVSQAPAMDFISLPFPSWFSFAFKYFFISEDYKLVSQDFFFVSGHLGRG